MVNFRLLRRVLPTQMMPTTTYLLEEAKIMHLRLRVPKKLVYRRWREWMRKKVKRRRRLQQKLKQRQKKRRKLLRQTLPRKMVHLK